MANVTRAQLSTTSATNFPDNTSQLISPFDLRDWITDGIDSFVTQKDVSTFQNAFYECKGSTLTAAATVNLALATGNFVHVSGTTTISSFGTLPAGARFILYFEDAVVVTYNATTLIIPGAANITTTAGDCMMVISEGSGSWRVVGYFPGTGLPVGTVTAVTASSPLSSTGGNAPDISITQADSTTDGYLSSADWNTFDGKQDALSAGTGISIASNIVTNTAPDQTVALTAGTGISTSGTYPNFTIANTAPDQTVALTAGTGIGITGTYPNFTIANTASSGGTPGGADTQMQYNNGGAFGGVSDLTWDDVNNVLTINTPRIGQSTGNGHMHMHSINTSQPSGVTDYVTLWADKSPKQFGARFETDAYTSAFQFGATADRIYTLPDESGNVVLDTATQTLTNKTLTTPAITTPSITGIATLNNGASAGEIRLREGSGGGTNYTAVKAAATLASDYSLTLPTTQGGSGQVIVNDGTGQLSWANNGGATTGKFLGTTTPTTVTGTTSETLLSELLIPANTFTSGDCFTILFRARRLSQLATDRWNFYISNQSGIFSGKPLMGFQTIGNISQFGITVERNVTIYNATTTYYVNSTAARYDDFNNDNLSSSNIDWTVAQYIIMTCIPATTGQQIFNVSTHASPR